MTRRQTALAAFVLFATALLLRLPHLGGFLTPDEQRIWTTLTGEFFSALLRGDWAGTATSGYPGVTTTWAGSLGLALQWLLARPAGITGLPEMAAALLANPSRLDMIPWLRMGVAIVCAVGVVALFLLTRRLLNDAVALLAAAVLAVDPFLLAHTRILNTDPLLAIFLAVSWLSLLLATHTRQRGYFVLAGAAFGLALLTKTPALLALPIFVLWLFWQQGHRQPSAGAVLRAGLADLAWFAGPALLVAFLLWPALWVAPLATLRRTLEFAAALSQTGHELSNYWLGEPTARPGVLFYPAVLLWRTTPVTLLGLGLAFIGMFSRITGPQGHGRAAGWSEQRQTARALLAFVVWFALAMSLSPKKFDRYLLPVFPMVDILAAWGWIGALHWLFGPSSPLLASLQRTGSTPRAGQDRPSGPQPLRGAGLLLAVAAATLVFAQAAFALSNLPTYLTAYNPLLGGIRSAQWVMLVGWGEGLEEAAAYLNQEPHPERTRVAAWYGHNVFEPFYQGPSADLYYDLPGAADLYADDVGFVVTYLNQLQRGLLHNSIQTRLGHPVMSSNWHGVPLAQVYAWPKPFGHTADRELAPGLRLLGWTTGALDPKTRQMPVALYWDATPVPTVTSQLPPVAIWLKDAAGEVWASQQQPVAARPENRVAGWLDRTAIKQELALALPAGLLGGSYRLEMAPAGGQGVILEDVELRPTSLAGATDLGVTTLPAQVLFGDAVRLVGYDLRQNGGERTLDLLWAAQGQPPATAKYFVHVVDPAGNIVAQQDGVLAAPAGQETAAWQQGQLVRQRVHLPASDVPPATALNLYVGLYRPDDGQRLPLMVDGQPVPDGRYLLPISPAAAPP